MEQEAGDQFDSERDETIVPHVRVCFQEVYSFKDLDTLHFGTGDGWNDWENDLPTDPADGSMDEDEGSGSDDSS